MVKLVAKVSSIFVIYYLFFKYRAINIHLNEGMNKAFNEELVKAVVVMAIVGSRFIYQYSALAHWHCF